MLEDVIKALQEQYIFGKSAITYYKSATPEHITEEEIKLMENITTQYALAIEILNKAEEESYQMDKPQNKEIIN